MRDGLLIAALSLVPQRTFSTALGRLAQHTASRLLIHAFAWAYRIDSAELDRPLSAFESLQAFFQRPLPPGARPIAAAEVVSPVDGTLAATGTIHSDRFQQSERQLGRASALLQTTDAKLDGQGYVVLYLSPRDYHGVHAPFAGRVTRLSYVPGRLWPVFAAATRRIPGLFEGNERLVVALETARGPAAVVLVGALGVGQIDCPLSEGDTLAAGDLVGRFGFGSTVILIVPRAAWNAPGGAEVRVGEPLTG